MEAVWQRHGLSDPQIACFYAPYLSFNSMAVYKNVHRWCHVAFFIVRRLTYYCSSQQYQIIKHCSHPQQQRGSQTLFITGMKQYQITKPPVINSIYRVCHCTKDPLLFHTVSFPLLRLPKKNTRANARALLVLVYIRGYSPGWAPFFGYREWAQQEGWHGDLFRVKARKEYLTDMTFTYSLRPERCSVTCTIYTKIYCILCNDYA
jgi:hypothetical protein